MSKGGYQIVNLKGINLTLNGDAVKVDGVYNVIEGTDKPCIIQNYSIDGVEKPSRWINFGVYEGNFDGFVGFNSEAMQTINLRVTAEDMVSLVLG